MLTAINEIKVKQDQMGSKTLFGFDSVMKHPSMDLDEKLLTVIKTDNSHGRSYMTPPCD